MYNSTGLVYLCATLTGRDIPAVTCSRRNDAVSSTAGQCRRARVFFFFLACSYVIWRRFWPIAGHCLTVGDPSPTLTVHYHWEISTPDILLKPHVHEDILRETRMRSINGLPSCTNEQATNCCQIIAPVLFSSFHLIEYTGELLSINHFFNWYKFILLS